MSDVDKVVEQLAKWEHMSQELKELKAKEMELRKEICKEFVNSIPSWQEGKIRVKTSVNPFNVKVEQGLNYKLNTQVLAQIWDDLSTEERECIKLKPVLIEPEYKTLDDSAILHEAVTTSLSAPVLTVNPV